MGRTFKRNKLDYDEEDYVDIQRNKKSSKDIIRERRKEKLEKQNSFGEYDDDGNNSWER